MTKEDTARKKSYVRWYCSSMARQRVELMAAEGSIRVAVLLL